MEELGYKVQKVVVEGTFGPYRILRLLFKSFLPVLKSNIVFCWFAFPSGFVGVFLSKIFGKPVTVNAVGQEVANVPLINYGFKRHWKWLTRWALTNADKVVAISMESAKNVQNLVSRKVEVIYEGIDVNKFKSDSEKNEGSMILSVGILNKLNIKRKGFETLIRCIPYVIKQFDNADLVIAGKKKEGYPILQALADELNVSNHVNFRGYVPDEELLKLYHQCALVAFPSIHEGFPTVISEALACEKPVVSTKLSAIPEVVNDECGILMNDPFSPEELANAILTLLKDPSLRNKLGRRGREIIVEHFSRENRKEKINDMLEDMLKKNNPYS
jgi:glycosyltransferase involved in cell wall biosynthesis